MVSAGDGECLVQLGIEHPLFLLVLRVAITNDIAGERKVALPGTLIGFRDLVVQAPLDVIDQQAVEGEAVFDAEALAGDGVVTLA